MMSSQQTTTSVELVDISPRSQETNAAAASSSSPACSLVKMAIEASNSKIRIRFNGKENDIQRIADFLSQQFSGKKIK